MEPLRDDDDAGEEETPDWKLLTRFIKLHTKSVSPASEAFIPRRGEKDFQPIEAHAETQWKALSQSREALFSALSAGVRGHSSRDHVQCIWGGANGIPQDPAMNSTTSRSSRNSQVVVPAYVKGVAKGVLFSSIGSWNRTRKRLELMPEELLYLIERGTVECWTEDDSRNGVGSLPMSVQSAWAEVIGTGRLTLERYQVYGYLKRLGYIVLRKQHVDKLWASQLTTARQSNTPSGYLTKLGLIFSALYVSISKHVYQLRQLVWRWSHHFFARKDAVASAVSCSLLCPGQWRSYGSVFRALRIIPSGSAVSAPPNVEAHPCSNTNQGYEVFYYVYKPNSRFPKTAPPAPDFEVCVVNAESMPIPTIGVMTELLSTTKSGNVPAVSVTPPASGLPSRKKWSFVTFFAQGPLSLFLSGPTSPRPNWPSRPNIFAKIKKGERNVLLAVVDHGVTSFLRFAETDFGDSPLVGGKTGCPT